MKSCLRLFIVVAILTSTAQAAPVYKWTDKDGVTHYTSTAPSKDAKPAELPKIARAKFKLGDYLPKTCDTHGGIACGSGADKDGSVICADGFTAASARFRFECGSPKLTISDISDVAPNQSFKVFVRNNRDVKAEKPIVTFHLESGDKIALSGPQTIEPYGMGEFELLPAQAEGMTISKPKEAQITVECSNCG